MEYLQYCMIALVAEILEVGFKPYYKWNTFNTTKLRTNRVLIEEVLNLIISGIPSIPLFYLEVKNWNMCFKPYYKWNTFNTAGEASVIYDMFSVF